MSEKLTIGLVQRKCSTDAAANLAGTAEAIRDAVKRGAQIVCLEELFRSQYFCREEKPANFSLAGPVPGPTSEGMSRLARELGIVIVAKLKLSAFSSRQKYCERKSSSRQTICAPRLTASRIASAVPARFAA